MLSGAHASCVLVFLDDECGLQTSLSFVYDGHHPLFCVELTMADPGVHAKVEPGEADAEAAAAEARRNEGWAKLGYSHGCVREQERTR